MSHIGSINGNEVDIPVEFQEFTEALVSKLPEAGRSRARVNITDGFRLGQAEVLDIEGVEIPSPWTLDADILPVFEFARAAGRAAIIPTENNPIQGA